MMHNIPRNALDSEWEIFGLMHVYQDHPHFRLIWCYDRYIDPIWEFCLVDQ